MVLYTEKGEREKMEDEIPINSKLQKTQGQDRIWRSKSNILMLLLLVIFQFVKLGRVGYTVELDWARFQSYKTD